MIKPVLKYPDPRLKLKSEEVLQIDKEIKDLAQDLIDTMEAYKGLGLSAPQLGILKRVIVAAVIKSSSEVPQPEVLINPIVRKLNGKKVMYEGCLSFPGIFEKLERPEYIQVEYLTPEKELKSAIFEDMEARAVLHEIDHLNGSLFIEKLSPVKRSLLETKLRKLSK